MTRKSWSVDYGRETRSFEIDSEFDVLSLTAAEIDLDVDESEAVREAIQNPIGSPVLNQLVRPGEKVCIITSDITRPCPSSVVLPPLIDELTQAGIHLDDITIVFALGSHRRHTQDEQRQLVGHDLYAKVHTVDSDPEDTVFLGTTKLGTPVNITSVVAQADRRICVGNIEYHYFAGYSGGGKALMPGVSDREAIQANHSRMVESYARAGAIDDNLLRLDMEEAADMCGCDFIVNVVLDEQKKIVKAVAGDHRQAHRAGCAFLDSLYKIPIGKRADLVIASPGGYPKDINLYQAQKALDNASQAVRDGGIIILTAACTEGYGEDTFEEWLMEADKPQDLIDRVRSDFRLGGHKAAAIATVANRVTIYLVSELSDHDARQAFMQPYNDLQLAVSDALMQLGPQTNVLIMAHAGSTLPSCSGL
jgi:nickel-dependent lactate racemase